LLLLADAPSEGGVKPLAGTGLGANVEQRRRDGSGTSGLNGRLIGEGENNMRHLFQPLFIAAFATLLAVAQPVAAQDYKYCLQGRQWGYPGNCGFSSYRQCMASASGTESGCGINPRYAYPRRGRH